MTGYTPNYDVSDLPKLIFNIIGVVLEAIVSQAPNYISIAIIVALLGVVGIALGKAFSLLNFAEGMGGA